MTEKEYGELLHALLATYLDEVDRMRPSKKAKAHLRTGFIDGFTSAAMAMHKLGILNFKAGEDNG